MSIDLGLVLRALIGASSALGDHIDQDGCVACENMLDTIQLAIRNVGDEVNKR